MNKYFYSVKQLLKKSWLTTIVLLFFLVFASFNMNAQVEAVYGWAKGYGTTTSDYNTSIATDVSGNVYTVGNFNGSITAFGLTSNINNLDVVITKHSAAGVLQWAKAIGGTGADVGYGIAIDSNSNVYVTGQFVGTAYFYQPTAISYLTSQNGSNDIFLAKYDTSGNLVWANGIGGPTVDAGFQIAVDASNNVYLTGYTTLSGNTNVFIKKCDANGAPAWYKTMGGTLADYGQGIAVDASNNVYITGSFQGTADFDPSASTANLTSAGGQDIFMAKYNASGDYVWAKSIGGNASFGDIGLGIAVDAISNVYITGNFSGTVDFDPSAATANLPGDLSQNIFMAKFNASGNYIWAKAIGSDRNDIGSGIALDAISNVYLTGVFAGTVDFDPSEAVANLTSASFKDHIFMAKYNTSGNYVWAKSMGANSVYGASGNGLAVDTSNNVYITGDFSVTVDFDPSVATANLIAVGQSDLFLAKYSQSGLCTPTFTQVPAICSGAALSALPTTSNNAVTGTWSPALNNTATTTYTFTPTAGSCDSTATMIITVNPKIDPVLSPFGTTTQTTYQNLLYFTRCTSSPTGTINLINQTLNQSQVASYTLNWGDGSPVANLTSFTSNITHSYNTGFYTLNISLTTIQGCNYDKNYQIFVGDSPYASLISPGNTTNLCLPTSSLEFAITNWALNSPDTTYSLNYGDGSPIVNLLQSNLIQNTSYYNSANPTQSLNYPVPHAYTNISCPASGFTAQLSITNTCGMATSIITNISVLRPPNSNFANQLVASVNSCVPFINTSIPSINVNCVESTKYVWDFGDDSSTYTITAVGTPDPPCHIYTTPGNYIVTLNSYGYCGVSSKARTICIEAPLVPQFTLNSTQSCSPAAISSTNTTNLSYSCNPPTYLWDITYAAGYCVSGTPTWSYSSGSAITANPSFNFVTPGTYNIKVTMTNSAGSVTSAIQTVIVKQPPVVLINSATPTTCQMANYTAVVNGCAPSTNPLVFSWSFPGGIPAVSSLLTPSTISYSTAGLKTVTLAVTNECGTTTDSKTFTINPSALPTISGSLTACQSATSQLTGSATASTSNPWVSSNVGVATVNATGLVTAVAPGTTTITYTANNGCAATAVFTVNPTVTPTFTTVASSCANTTLTALPTTSNNGISGTWSPALNNSTTTTYTFTPTAGQCANTTTQTITITAPKVTSAISFTAPVAALPSVTIGTQIWTNKNLDVNTYRDGTPIPQVIDLTTWNSLTTGAWCYFDNNPANGSVYGKLYNWYAVAGIYDAASLANPALRKQLAPQGWHVPTDSEWGTLYGFLGGTDVAGGKMKEIGTVLWQGPNSGATNSSGFTCLPGGYRYNAGFAAIGFSAWLWSSSEAINLNPWYRLVLYDCECSGVLKDRSKTSGLSVRLIKD
jgi:uncharacterized protein (TIGR02145 family)